MAAFQFVQTQSIRLSQNGFDNDFEIRSRYYCLHSPCFYLNLRSSRCCFSKFVSFSSFLNCRLVVNSFFQTDLHLIWHTETSTFELDLRVRFVLGSRRGEGR